MPSFVEDNLSWFAAGAVVLLGLCVYGLRDLLRVSLGRVWAIGGVCFRDAIRRRVLWITPMAILGIVLVSQLQKPEDEPDAIRLTIKVCLFTIGLVVTVIAVITAATNLPREIESRVIFTIVTKPVTRLEIVFGKIVGFARVSFVILLVMGTFTYGYLSIRSYFLTQQMTQTLASPTIDAGNREWLSHFTSSGLLVSQSVEQPDSSGHYARLPNGDERWAAGGLHDAVEIFQLKPNEMGIKSEPTAPAGSGGAVILLNIGFERIKVAPEGAEAAAGVSDPTQPPTVSVQLIDVQSGAPVVTAEMLSAGAVPLTDPTGKQSVSIVVPPERAIQLAGVGQRPFYVQITPGSGDYLYRFGTDAIQILVPDSATETRLIQSARAGRKPQLRGREGRAGQQLTGPRRGVQPVAVYQFRDIPQPKSVDGRVPFELTAGVEQSGDDADTEVATAIEVRVYDRPKQKLSPPQLIYPENRRTIFFSLPAEFMANRDFDIVLANKTQGHSIGLTDSSIALVANREPFAWNLTKGLVVLWLMSILVSTIALCCSTFLSWPIAVVLTLLVILGRWGVSNLDIGSGMGAQFAQEFFPNNAGAATVVNQSVEKLTNSLVLLASILPDISPFGVIEQIERGVSIRPLQLAGPIEVMLVFGLPLATLAYVFLRNKEVAP